MDGLYTVNKVIESQVVREAVKRQIKIVRALMVYSWSQKVTQLVTNSHAAEVVKINSFTLFQSIFNYSNGVDLSKGAVVRSQ
jgi:hypothetical protein